MSHGEPFLLRSYAGKVEKLPAFLADILADKEVVVPCMVDGDKEAIHKKTARIQRLKASLKILDYNPKRDFVGWGGEDIRRLAGMAGFDRYAGTRRSSTPRRSRSRPWTSTTTASRTSASAGRTRSCCSRTAATASSRPRCPGLAGGARAAVWADHNGDGLPDLLLATPDRPAAVHEPRQGPVPRRHDVGCRRKPRTTSPRPRGATSTATASRTSCSPTASTACGFTRTLAPMRRRSCRRSSATGTSIGMFRAANPADNFKTEFPIEKEKFNREEDVQGQARHR